MDWHKIEQAYRTGGSLFKSLGVMLREYDTQRREDELWFSKRMTALEEWAKLVDANMLKTTKLLGQLTSSESNKQQSTTSDKWPEVKPEDVRVGDAVYRNRKQIGFVHCVGLVSKRPYVQCVDMDGELDGYWARYYTFRRPPLDVGQAVQTPNGDIDHIEAEENGQYCLKHLGWFPKGRLAPSKSPLPATQD